MAIGRKSILWYQLLISTLVKAIERLSDTEKGSGLTRLISFWLSPTDEPFQNFENIPVCYQHSTL